MSVMRYSKCFRIHDILDRCLDPPVFSHVCLIYFFYRLFTLLEIPVGYVFCVQIRNILMLCFVCLGSLYHQVLLFYFLFYFIFYFLLCGLTHRTEI